MPDFSRRSIILGTAGIAAAGAGVTAAAGGLQGSVEGQADVQAEQALTVTEVNIDDSNGQQDASFTRTSDDNTEFQAAVELNNGDSVVFEAEVENSAADALDVQVAVDSPDPIDIDVRQFDNGNGSTTDPDNTNVTDLDPDDNGTSGSGDAVQTGEGTFITSIAGGSSGDSSAAIDVAAELDDTAEPGSYDIGVAINPLSTDN